jgi:hypothetical protein
MITYQSQPVRIIGGDRKLREAKIESPTGKILIVGLHQLRGTRGGFQEVVVVWGQACANAERSETERER